MALGKKVKGEAEIHVFLEMETVRQICCRPLET